MFEVMHVKAHQYHNLTSYSNNAEFWRRRVQECINLMLVEMSPHDFEVYGSEQLQFFAERGYAVPATTKEHASFDGYDYGD